MAKNGIKKDGGWCRESKHAVFFRKGKTKCGEQRDATWENIENAKRVIEKRAKHGVTLLGNKKRGGACEIESKREKGEERSTRCFNVLKLKLQVTNRALSAFFHPFFQMVLFFLLF